MPTNGQNAVEVRAAIERWKALPDDERSGERPFVMGFNAGWQDAVKQAAGVAKQYEIADHTGRPILPISERIRALSTPTPGE